MGRTTKIRTDPALQLLGLAARAGAVSAGTARVQDQVRQGRARFVVVAEDLTETGRDKLIPLLESRHTPYTVRYERARLGQAVGKGPLAAVAVTQADLATRIEAMLGNG